MKHLYDACMEVDIVNADQARPLANIISQLGKSTVSIYFSFFVWIAVNKENAAFSLLLNLLNQCLREDFLIRLVFSVAGLYCTVS